MEGALAVLGVWNVAVTISIPALAAVTVKVDDPEIPVVPAAF